MQKIYCFKNAINFIKKGITLSLLILLSATVYSNPIGKNTDRKTGYNFFAESPSFTFRANPNGEGSYSTTDCTYSLSTSNITESEAGSGTVTVSTGAGCAWEATKNVDWITFTTVQSGTGNGSLGYTYNANMSTLQRTGTITIARQTFTITQAARPLVADRYEPNNTVGEITQAGMFTPTFTENASTLSISPATCHNSTDIDIYKINLETGYYYTISGVLYDMDNNQANNTNYTLDVQSFYSTDGSNWLSWGDSQLSNKIVEEETLYIKIIPRRSGNTGTYAARININRTINCRLRLLLTSREVSSESGNGQVTVTTSPLCTSPSIWTSSVTSGANWITLTSGLSGTGNGTMAYSYTANTEWSSRTGTIAIAGQTYTVIQLPPPITPDSYEGITGNNTVAQAHIFLQPVFNSENASTISILAANCHNIADIDYYKINLENGYIYTIRGALHDQFNQIAESSYTLDAKISYSTNGSNWVDWGDSQLPDKTVQGGTLYLKIKPHTRGKVGTYAARIDIKKAATADCTYTLLPTSREATEETDNGQINVTTGPSCFRTATSNANWITLTSGQSATGSGSVAYTYKANRATLQRTGTIIIADKTFTITQAGRPLVSDSYEPNNTVEEAAQAGTFTPTFTENAVTLSISPATCHNSTDIDIYKINLEAGYSYTISCAFYNALNQIDNSNYTLPGKVSYSTNGSTWIYQGNGQLPNKTMQGGTLYLKIEPNSSGGMGTYAAKIDINRTGDCSPVLLLAISEVSSETGNGQVTVMTRPSCTSPSGWTATSAANWITLTSGQNGTGNGTVGYSYTANTEWSSRTGTITIADKTYTVNQLPPSLTPDSYEGSAGNNTAEQAWSFPQPLVFNNENASTLSISGANCHNVDDVDIYKIILGTEYSYTINGVLYDRFNQTAESSYTLDVKISCSTNGTNWIEWGNSQLPGKTVQGGTFYLKIEPITRGNVGTYAARIDIKKAATAYCTYLLFPTSREETAETGNGHIIVITDQSCFRTATSNANWITLTSGQSATGAGTVAYTYKANMATDSRAGTIIIAGRTYTINQAGRPLLSDNYEPNNTVAEVVQAATFTPTFTENASMLSISPATCHNSTDIDIYKINLETGYSYTISGVLYDMDNNRANHTNYTLDVKSFYSTDGTTWNEWGDSQLLNKTVLGETLYIKIIPHRSGNTGTYAAKIDINRTVGCYPDLLLASSEVLSEAGNGQITVTTSPSCTSPSPWTATVTSGANWITLTSGQSGTGNGTVAYSYTANTAWSSRTGTITIADKTYTVTQLPPPLTPDSYEGSTGNNTSAQAHTFPQPVFNNENASTLSISGANCHHVDDVDYYKINLESGYIYTISGALYDRFNQTAGSSYTLDVKISYSTDGSRWVYWGNSQLSGKTAQGETLYFKIEPYTRGNVGTYAASIDINKTTTIGCTYTLLSASREATTEADNGQLEVTTGTSCIRTATSNANWITLTSGQSATGSGSVAYTYKANMATVARTGTITIANQTFTINQADRPLISDSYEPNNTVAEVVQAGTFTPTFTENASTLSISPATCHNSTDIDIYKINLEAGYSYALSGILCDTDNNQANNTNYTLDVKSSWSTDGIIWNEWGNIQLSSPTVGGETLYIKIVPHRSRNTGTYAAKIDINRTIDCNSGLLLASSEVSSEAGNGQVTVTTSPLCTSPSPWTATVTSGANWITLTSGQSGTGNGTAEYSYTANTAWVSRTGTITIAGKTYTVTQLPRPLSPDSYEGSTGNNTAEQAFTFPQPVFNNENASTLSISDANCHNPADVDIYKINLETEYSYTISGALYDRLNQVAGSSYTLDVKISYSTNGYNWVYWGDSQLLNEAVQGGTLYLKIEPYTRGNTGTYAASIEINKTTTIGCTYTLLPASMEATTEADNGQLEVTTGTSCVRAAASNANWITLTSGQSATGSGSVAYTYKANRATLQRTGTITIANKTFTIIQAGRPLIADNYEPNNTVAEIAQAVIFTPTFTDNASTLSISPATCHNSTDIDIYKINLEAGYSYTLSGVLYDTDNNQTNHTNYTLDVISSYSTDGSNWPSWGDSQLSNKTVQGETLYIKIVPRIDGSTGTYAAKIDINRTVDCSLGLSLASSEVSSEAGNDQVTVTTSPLCTSPSSWTATSTANWITLTSGQNGTGNGTVGYSYTANTAWAPRTGTITIADKTYTVTQLHPPLMPDSYEGSTGNNTEEQAHTFPQPVFNNENESILAISDANCHNLTDIDFYKINLEAGYIYTINGALYDRVNQMAGSSYTLDVKGSYSTNGTQWIDWRDNQLPEKTVQGGTHYFKIEPQYRGNMGTYAAKIDIKKTASSNCTYSLLPVNREATPETDNGQIEVATGPSCIRTATSNANWITLTSGQSATGSGIVAYTYQTNMATVARTGTITIAAQTFTINQAGRPLVADSYEPNNTVEEVAQADTFTPTFTENASTLSISPVTCHNSTDIDIYKINLEAGYLYTLSGVLYDIDNNQANHTSYTLDVKSSWSTDGTIWNEWGDIQLSRPTVEGTLYIKIIPHTGGSTGTYAATIELNRTVDCRPRFVPASKGTASEAGNDLLTVTIGESCVWEATASVDWIMLTSGLSGTGNGTVGYSYTENTAASLRTGTITIEGQPFIITQEGHPFSSDSYEPNNTAEEVSQASTFTPSFAQKESSIFISPANSHHVDDVDIYKINLETGYSYAVRSVLYDLGNQINNSNYSLDARISYLADGPDWSKEEHQLQTLRVPGGTLYLKIKPFSNENLVGTYAAKIDIKITGGCTCKLSAMSREVTPAAGNNKIEVTAGSLCDWTATSNADWITITSGQSGKGPGSVEYSYTESKTETSRTGTITVGGQTFTVNQSVVTGIETTGNIKIFPNPARDFVTIDFSGTNIKSATVKIANQLGQILYVQDSPNQILQIPLKRFTGGVYFIFLQGEEKTWVQKLMIK